MTDIETGSDRPRGLILSLNTDFVESLSSDQLAGYLDAVQQANRLAVDADEAEVETYLRQTLDTHGIELAEPSYARLTEQLTTNQAGSVTVITNRGDTLLGDPNAASREPDVHGREDPEHPDRPTLGA